MLLIAISCFPPMKMKILFKLWSCNDNSCASCAVLTTLHRIKRGNESPCIDAWSCLFADFIYVFGTELIICGNRGLFRRGNVAWDAGIPKNTVYNNTFCLRLMKPSFACEPLLHCEHDSKMSPKRPAPSSGDESKSSIEKSDMFSLTIMCMDRERSYLRTTLCC